MQPRELSKTDASILNQVFDPESGPSSVEVIVDPALPQDRHVANSTLLAELKARERTAIKAIEAFETAKDASPTAKDKAYRSALQILDSIIESHPDYASARNNRAQLRRWRFGDRNMICYSPSSKREESKAGACTVSDLRQAVSLASPERPQDAVSPAQGKLLAQAYTQLGALFLSASKDHQQNDDPSQTTSFEVVDENFASWTQQAFEEEASRCFYLGGLYGNEVAKALAVHTNPHAKLCGNIVKEAMRKEFADVAA